MPVSLDSAIQEKQHLIEAITYNSRRLTLPLLAVLLKTFAPPVLVFGVTATVTMLLAGETERRAPGLGLSTTVQIVGLIVTLVLMWRVWRWAEARFGGGALLRRLRQVTLAVFALETAIDAAKAQPTPTDVEQINHLNHHTWKLFTDTLRAYGLEVR